MPAPAKPKSRFLTLRFERLADRCVITLNRPRLRNAINARMVAELHEACAQIEAKPQPVIITGAGTDFAAGADINELRERGRDEALMGINRVLFDRIAALPLPVFAAVQGYALGGGAELAYACDVRFADDSAVFGNPEPGLGILAAAGALYRLGRLVGTSVASQVLLAGHRLDAAAAERFGLVMPVVPRGTALEAAQQAMDRLCRQSMLALRLTKAALRAEGAHPAIDDIAQAVLFESADKRERMSAFLEKRRGR